MMVRLPSLKAAIFNLGMTQRKLAKELKISEAVLSGIVNGRIIATEKEKRLISRALQKHKMELFDGRLDT